jgi:dihydroxyacid dehydratase/phosphogluconate dehydratase
MQFLHLLAMAHSADVELDLDDFTEIGKASASTL